ncbi:MAG: hypothetical protein ACRDOB_19650 [Streptosporangiaceae bacterium]
MAQHTQARPVTAEGRHQAVHHHWLFPGVIIAVIAGIQALFVFCLGYPMLHASPHAVPIAVAGLPAQTRPLEAALNRHPGAFDVRTYPDTAAARTAIRERDVYGALAVTPSGPELLLASAASPQVAALLTSQAQALGHGHPVPVTDVVPAPAKDPEETGALTTLLPLVLLSVALGAILAHAEHHAWRRLGWCLAAAAAAGLAVSGVARGLGTFTGHYWADAGVLALLVFGLSACAASLIAVRPLRPLGSLFALTMLFIGIPAAGALVPPELLAQPWRAIGPDLPPGAALSALRGITFFSDAATGRPLAVLACWAGLGALLALLVPAAAARRHR